MRIALMERIMKVTRTALMEINATKKLRKKIHQQKRNSTIFEKKISALIFRENIMRCFLRNIQRTTNLILFHS